MSYGNLLARVIPLLLLCSLHAQPALNEETVSLWQELEKPETSDDTSLKLMELNIKARGGEKALKAVHSVRFHGRLIEGKTDYEYQAVISPYESIRIEQYRYHIGRDYTKIFGYDGENAWTVATQPKKGLPSKLTGLEKQLLDFHARQPFLFLDSAEQGTVFAYLGKQKYAGRDCYLIHGWLKSGMELEVHLDATSFQIINYRIPFKIAGKVFIVDQTPTKLVAQDGVWWESGYRTHVRGKTFRRLSYDAIETNLPPSQDAFTEPSVKEFWLRQKR